MIDAKDDQVCALHNQESCLVSQAVSAKEMHEHPMLAEAHAQSETLEACLEIGASIAAPPLRAGTMCYARFGEA